MRVPPLVLLSSSVALSLAIGAAGASDLAGYSQIVAVRADGSGVRNLTHWRFDDEWPAVSPDGRRIAFVRTASSPGLWIMNADGSGQRKIANVPGAHEVSPDWSPDGKRIVFVSMTPCEPYFCSDLHLWLVRPDGSGLRKIGQNVRQPWRPLWSPDGKRLLLGQILDPARADRPARRPASRRRSGVEAWPSDGGDGVDVRGLVVVAGRTPSRVHGVERQYERRVRRGCTRAGPTAFRALRLRSPAVARRRRNRRHQALWSEHGAPRYGFCARRDGESDRVSAAEVCMGPQRPPSRPLSRPRACRGGAAGWPPSSADVSRRPGWPLTGPTYLPAPARPLVVVAGRPDVLLPRGALRRATPRARRGPRRPRPGRLPRRGSRAPSRRRARRQASPSSSPRGRGASAGARPCRPAPRAP